MLRPPTDRGVKTTKTMLLEAINKRFDHVQSKPHFYIATSHDPRYKDSFFDEVVKEHARETLDEHLTLCRPSPESRHEMHGREDADHSPSKRAGLDGAGTSLHDMLEEILVKGNRQANHSNLIVSSLNLPLPEMRLPLDTAKKTTNVFQRWPNWHASTYAPRLQRR